ncbi:MAG: hypothetical protein HY736_22345 [Verrucomicrobia bacterium]|nr:hypothetical protein [Verrucomicrobiota bacterium]
MCFLAAPGGRLSAADAKSPLKVTWEKNYLTIAHDRLPGPIRIHYLEAYCRPGSTDREWRETVIRHKAELVSSSADGRVIKIRDTLEDGVVVEHTISASDDEVDFRLVARNPTDRESQAHWAQPCVRVNQFTGHTVADARTLVPAYARQCFLFIEGKLTMLPTEPWADKARYVPGQVYCPRQVDRNDVNPRPLSPLVPSNGLCGSFSADGRQIMAMAWEPYQEIFQGVIACLHNDFRIGGLRPGETKNIRGKIYLVAADVAALVKRFEADFPEQAAKNPG